MPNHLTQKQHVSMSLCVLAALFLCTVNTVTTETTSIAIQEQQALDGEIRRMESTGVALIDNPRADEGERELDVELLSSEMKSFQEFERSLSQRDDSGNEAVHKQVKDKFERDLLDMFEQSELCELGHLSRNRYLSHFVKFLRTQGLIKKDSERRLERRLLKGNSGRMLWDQYEDVFMRGGLVSLFSDEELDRAKTNLKRIMDGLDGDFVQKVLHDEAEKGLAQSKTRKSLLMVKIRKKLKSFCYEERKDRELGKLNYLSVIAGAVARKLSKQSELNDFSLSQETKQAMDALEKNHLVLKEDVATFGKIVNDIGHEDAVAKRAPEPQKRSIKDAFLAFLDAQGTSKAEERKLVISKKDKKFDADAFVERVEEKLQKQLSIESNASLLAQFESFVHKGGHKSAEAVRSRLTAFFKEMKALGKVARRQELQVKNLARAVLLDSFLVRRFNVDAFFRELESRAKDKAKKHVVEGIFLHFLKNTAGADELSEMLGTFREDQDQIANKFDTLGESLAKQGLVSRDELALMKPRVLYDFRTNLNADVGLDRELSNFRELRLVTMSALTSAPVAASPRLLKRCRRFIGKSRQHGMSKKVGFILLIARRFIKEFGSETFASFDMLKVRIREFLMKLVDERLLKLGEVEAFTDQLRSLLMKFMAGQKLNVSGFEAHFKGYHEEQSMANLRFRIGNIILTTGEGGLTETQIASTKERLRKYERKYKFNLEDLVLEYKKELPQEEDTQELYKQIADKLNGLNQKDQDQIIFMLQQLFELAGAIDFSHVAKLKAFLESFFAQFSNISGGDRQAWLELIVKLVVPRVAAIEKLTDEDILAKFKERYPGVVDSMDEEAQKFLNEMLIKYIKLLVTSEKRELQFFKEKLTDFLKSPAELESFMAKLEHLGGNNKSEKSSQRLDVVLKQLSDFFIKHKQLSHIFKIYLQLAASGESLSKEVLGDYRKQVEDFEHQSPEMGHLLKLLAQARQGNVTETVQQVHSVVKALIDNAQIEVQVKSFLLKINKQLNTLSNVQLEELKQMVQKLKDNLVSVETMKKFIAAVQYLQKSNFLVNSSAKLQEIARQVADFETQFPDITFLIKTLFEVRKTPSVEGFKKLDMAVRAVQDSKVEITQDLQFLLKTYTEAYISGSSEREGRLRQVMGKMQDYLVETEPYQKFIAKWQITQQGFLGAKEARAVLGWDKMVQDFEIKFPDMTFLIKSLFETPNASLAETLSEVTQAVKAVQDHHIEIDNVFQFLIKNFLEVSNAQMTDKESRLKALMKQMKDHLIEVQPYAEFIQKWSLVNEGVLGQEARTQFNHFQKIYRDFEIQMPEMSFLVSSVLQANQVFNVDEVQKVAIAMQMVQDNRIEIQSPIRFLIKQFLEVSGFSAIAETKKLMTILEQLKDEKIEISPGSFVLGTMSTMVGGMDLLQTSLVDETNRRVRDYLVMVQTLGFLMSGLRQVSQMQGFGDTKVFKAALETIKDNFIEVQTPTVLYKFLVQMQHHISAKKTTVLKSVLEGLRDYLILTTNFVFTVKSHFKRDFPELFRKMRRFVGFWKLFKDYLVSPLPFEAFVIKSLLFSKQGSQVKRLMRFKKIRQIVKDNHILVNAHFQNFLLRNLLTFFRPFRFASLKKFHLVLAKFVDALILPQGQRKFLLRSILSLYKPSMDSSIRLSTNFLNKRMVDQMIHVHRDDSFLLKGWVRDDKRVDLEKLMRLQAYWKKMRDFLVSPLPIDQFILMSLVLPSKRMSARRRQHLKSLLRNVRDYPNLLDPNFGKFLLKSAWQFFKDFRIANVSKLKFMLRKFVDAFILTDSEIKFLLKAFSRLITRSPYANRRLRFNAFFRRVKDSLIQLQGHAFLLKADAHTRFESTRKKLAALKVFWSKLRDFLVSPDPMNKFLLKMLFLQTSTARLKVCLKNSFILKQLHDYFNLVSPPFRIFLLRSLFQLSQPFRFRSRAKLHLFLRKFVDALNVPETPGKFLLKMLFRVLGPHLSAKGRLKFRVAFKQTIDKFTPIERNDLFLQKSKITLLFPERQSQVEQLGIYLRRFRDFFVSPLSTTQFILASLFTSPNTYTAQQLLSFKGLLKKYRDLPIFLSDFRKFYLASLFRLFRPLKFHSIAKLRFALRRYVDHFIFPDNVRQFLLKFSLSLLRHNFISQSTLDMSLVLKVLRDFKIDPRVPGKFLLKSQVDAGGQYLRKSLVRFRAFLAKMRDYLVHPVPLNIFLIRQIALQRADLVLNNFASFRAKFTKVRDFRVFPEAYLAFLLRYVQKMSQDLRFSSKAKLRLFLRKTLDQLVQPDRLDKFLLKLLMRNMDGGVSVHGKLRFNLTFSRFLDHYIAVHGPSFLLNNRFYLRAKKQGLRMVRFRAQLRHVQDFFIAPEGLKKFMLKSLLRRAGNLTALRQLWPRLFLRRVQDYPNLVQPKDVMFLMMALVKMFPKFKIISRTQIKFMFRHFLDAFMMPQHEIKFLIGLMQRLYRTAFNSRTVSLKAFLYRFADKYIPVQPNTFFIQLFMKNRRFARAASRLKMKAKLAVIKDNKIEVDNLLSFFLASVLRNRRKSATKFFHKISATWRKTKDNFLFIRNRDFLVKMLSYNVHPKKLRKTLTIRALLKKFRDFHILTYRLNAFLLKMYLTYFGDFRFKDRKVFKMFWKRFMDNFIDVFHRNLMNAFVKEYSKASNLRHGFFQVGKILRKFKMGYNFRYIRGVNATLKRLENEKKLVRRTRDFKALFRRQKMRFNQRQIRGINALYKNIQRNGASASRVGKSRAGLSRRKMGFLKRGIRGVNAGVKKYLKNAIESKLNLSTRTGFERRKMGFLKRAIRGVNLKQVLKTDSDEVSRMENRVRGRMYRMRMQFLRRGPGWSVTSKETKNVPLGTFRRMRFRKILTRKNIKVYYKYWAREIQRLKKARQASLHEGTVGFLRLGKSRLKIRMHEDMLSMTSHSKDQTIRKKAVNAQTGKVQLKPVYPEQKMQGKDDKIRVFYKRMKELNVELSKIKAKVLHFGENEAFKQKEGMNSIRDRLKTLDSNFAKTILKPLEFVNFPKMSRNYAQSFHKAAIGISLNTFQKKLRGVRKVFLQRAGYRRSGKSNAVGAKMARRIKKVYTGLKKLRKYRSIKKVLLNGSGWKSGNKVTDKETRRIKTAYARVKDMLDNKHYAQNYDALEKIMLRTGFGGGNKMTEEDAHPFKLQAVAKTRKQRKRKAFENLLDNVKILLKSSFGHGNKLSDKPALVRRFVGEIFKKHYGSGKKALDFQEFRRVYLRFHRNLSAPVYYKAAFDLIEKLRKAKALDKGFSGFRKMLLEETLSHGNKETEKDPHVSNLQTRRSVLHAFKSIDHRLEASKKILVKSLDLPKKEECECPECCCEFLVFHSSGEESEEEEAEEAQEIFGRGGVIDTRREIEMEHEKQLLRAVARGEAEDVAMIPDTKVWQILGLDPSDERAQGWSELGSPGHAYLQHEAEELLENLDETDLECSNKKHKIFNILPDVHFDMTLKRIEQTEREKELTTTGDIPGLSRIPRGSADHLLERFNSEFERDKTPSLEPPKWMKDNGRIRYKAPPLEGATEEEADLLRESKDYTPDFHKMMLKGKSFLGKDFHEEHHYSKIERPLPVVSVDKDDTIDML